MEASNPPPQQHSFNLQIRKSTSLVRGGKSEIEWYATLKNVAKDSAVAGRTFHGVYLWVVEKPLLLLCKEPSSPIMDPLNSCMIIPLSVKCLSFLVFVCFVRPTSILLFSLASTSFFWSVLQPFFSSTSMFVVHSFIKYYQLFLSIRPSCCSTPIGTTMAPRCSLLLITCRLNLKLNKASFWIWTSSYMSTPSPSTQTTAVAIIEIIFANVTDEGSTGILFCSQFVDPILFYFIWPSCGFGGNDISSVRWPCVCVWCVCVLKNDCCINARCN